MKAETKALQCPNCGGTLEFDPETGKVTCAFCESAFTAQELDRINRESEAARKSLEEPEGLSPAATDARVPQGRATDAEATQGRATDAKASGARATDGTTPAVPGAAPTSRRGAVEAAHYQQMHWDASTISDDWGEETDNLVAYSCSRCGGEIIGEPTTGATQCPYCGNSTIVPGQFSIGHRPDYVIPFKIARPQALKALKRHYRGKPFLPSEFSRRNQVQKLQGVYVPFWLFNGTCEAQVQFDARISSSHRDDDYIVTTTEHYDVEREGEVCFTKIPVDASSKMPDDVMDSLEPFDYSQLTPFTPSVFAGFIANRYDLEAQDCFDRADARCRTTALATLQSDVTGYQTVEVKHEHVQIRPGAVEYALLPIYTIKTAYEGKTYLFAMNGQTGKLVGDLPVSRKKFWTFCACVTLALGFGLYWLGVGGALADFVWLLLCPWGGQ